MRDKSLDLKCDPFQKPYCTVRCSVRGKYPVLRYNVESLITDRMRISTNG